MDSGVNPGTGSEPLGVVAAFSGAEWAYESAYRGAAHGVVHAAGSPGVAALA